MRKIAIFVEGQAERLFTIELLRVIARSAHLHINLAEQYRGGLVFTLNAPAQGNATHLVLLVDCHNDEQVKTQIAGNYANLVAAGYSAILGLRDVYPHSLADVPRIMAAMNVGLPAGAVPISLHISISELESWFIGEVTHFARIDAKLTPAFIVAQGFDIVSVPAENWAPAAEVLARIYKLAGKGYRKKLRHVERTIAALSQAELFSTVRGAMPEFGGYIDAIENAMNLPRVVLP